MQACTASSPLIVTWSMVALAPSATKISAVPLAATPFLPLLDIIDVFLTVTLRASISSTPSIFWQLITAFAVRTSMTRRRLVPRGTSRRPGHCDRFGPVLAGPGQPQAARLAQRRAPPARQYRALGLAAAASGLSWTLPGLAGPARRGHAAATARITGVATAPGEAAEAGSEPEHAPTTDAEAAATVKAVAPRNLSLSARIVTIKLLYVTTSRYASFPPGAPLSARDGSHIQSVCRGQARRVSTTSGGPSDGRAAVTAKRPR